MQGDRDWEEGTPGSKQEPPFEASLAGYARYTRKPLVPPKRIDTRTRSVSDEKLLAYVSGVVCRIRSFFVRSGCGPPGDMIKGGIGKMPVTGHPSTRTSDKSDQFPCRQEFTSNARCTEAASPWRAKAPPATALSSLCPAS